MKKQIFFDEQAYQFLMQDIDETLLKINFAIDGFNQIGIGTVNDTVYKNFFSEEKMNNHIKTEIEKSLKKAGMTINSIKEAAIENALDEFETKCLPSLQTANKSMLKYIELKDGKAICPENMDRIARDRFTVYLESAEAEKYYNQLQDIAKTLNHLSAITKEPFMRTFRQLFYLDNNDNLKVRDELNYNTLVAMESDCNGKTKPTENDV